MKVKICGLTNKDDAVWAVNYGADYIGFNFYKKSPRHISVASASKWINDIPSFVSTVGLFVDEGIDEIVKTVQKLRLKGIQLHGNESPEFVKELKERFLDEGLNIFVIKAFRVKDENYIEEMKPYQSDVDYFLLDTFVPDVPGGTGESFNWNWASKTQELGKPVFIAGGLTSQNVKQAVKKAQPFAVDVSSGVEKSPKRKDPDKMKEFIAQAK